MKKNKASLKNERKLADSLLDGWKQFWHKVEKSMEKEMKEVEDRNSRLRLAKLKSEQSKYRHDKKEADKLLAELPAWWKQVEKYDCKSRRIATPGRGMKKKVVSSDIEERISKLNECISGLREEGGTRKRKLIIGGSKYIKKSTNKSDPRCPSDAEFTSLSQRLGPDKPVSISCVEQLRAKFDGT